MTDSTPIIGTGGTLATFGLGQINEIVGICVGITTLVYLAIKIKNQLTDKNGKRRN
jgi:hypothetical protein|tara:strand:+ start:448 stop:615 length:168 start_codon:yes stop_codon:yes gene_type:complete